MAPFIPNAGVHEFSAPGSPRRGRDELQNAFQLSQVRHLACEKGS
jgi:hypothetical protein